MLLYFGPRRNLWDSSASDRKFISVAYTLSGSGSAGRVLRWQLIRVSIKPQQSLGPPVLWAAIVFRRFWNTYDQVIAIITRRPLDNEHPRLTQRVLESADLAGLQIRADDVFCTLGSHPVEAGREEFEIVEFEYPKILARQAVDCGARQFLFVTIVDTKHSSGFRRFTRMKRDLERTIAKFPFDVVHVFRPSLLRGHRDRPRADERWMHARDATNRTTPDRTFKQVSRDHGARRRPGDVCSSITRRYVRLPRLPLSRDAGAR